MGCTIEGGGDDTAGIYTSLAEQFIKYRGQQEDSSNACSLGKIPAAEIAGGETTVTLAPTGSGKVEGIKRLGL